MKSWPLIVAVLCGCAHGSGGAPGIEVEFYRGNPSRVECTPTGPCLIAYEGVTRAEGALEGGKPEGVWRFYDAKGALREEGSYAAGRRQGTWRYYGVFVSKTGGESIELTTRTYENNEVEATGEYVDGVMKGPWSLRGPAGTMVYPMSGEVLTTGSQDGFVKLDGPFVQTAPNGTKVAEGRYQDAQAVGEWRRWYADGRLQSIRNPPNGAFIDFYESGARRREGTLAGSLDVWNANEIEWHEEMPLVRDKGENPPVWRYGTKQDVDGNALTDLGQPCPEGTIVAGAIDGERVEQWCQKSTSDTLAPKHGPFRAWSIQWGYILDEGGFADGKRDGAWRSWDQDDAEVVTTYKAGKKHGKYFVRRANQQMKVVGEYANDLQNGEWTYFNANGQPERVEKWKNGKQLE